MCQEAGVWVFFVVGGFLMDYLDGGEEMMYGLRIWGRGKIEEK